MENRQIALGEWEHEGRLGKASGQRHAFVHPDGTMTWHLVQDATREQVVELYRRWIADRPELRAEARQQLAGRDLMCWCPLPEPGQPDHCHAAVLLGIANSPEARLTCFSPEDAAAVVEEATRPGDIVHTVRQEGRVVVIGYFDKRWPFDVADWAGENGHCTDHAAASVIARL